MDSENGLDLDSLFPKHSPEYTTSPGTSRDGTLIRGYRGQKKLNDTVRGAAYCGDSRELLKDFEGDVDLIVTSPPFGLQRQKEYGNENPDEYISWFLEFASLAYEVLDEEGDLVIDIGGSWERGEPIRSTYHFELLVELATEGGLLNQEYGQQFNLAQDFYWYNPAKLPTPAQWVTIERIRVKDAVNHVWWLTKDNARDRDSSNPDNTAVLKPYSDAQKDLMENGYKDKLRPSGHDISDQFDNPKENGAIRPNFWNVVENSLEAWGLHDILDLAGVSADLRRGAEQEDRLEELVELAIDDEIIEKIADLQGISGDMESPVMEIANTRSRTHYLVGCDKLGMDPHPARFPRELPYFFIEFLTEPDDLVLDMFAGSNLTGWVAQKYDRNWISIEKEEEYIKTSRLWFMSMDDIEEEVNERMDSNEAEQAAMEPEN